MHGHFVWGGLAKKENKVYQFGRLDQDNIKLFFLSCFGTPFLLTPP